MAEAVRQKRGAEALVRGKELRREVAEVVAKYPDKTALIYMGARISSARSTRWRTGCEFLIKSGLKRTMWWGLHLPNIPAHYIGVLGVQKAGCVSTGLSPLLTAPKWSTSSGTWYKGGSDR